MVASQATRNYLINISDEIRDTYLPNLLPAMCFNRYFLAEGIKVYSQDTWLMVFKENGRLYVEKYLPKVVEYYLKQLELSDNPTVREVACACIGELAAKMSKNLLEPYIKDIVKMLMYAFNTHLWNVRDGKWPYASAFILNLLFFLI